MAEDSLENMPVETGGINPDQFEGLPAENTGDTEADLHQPAGSEAPQDNLVEEKPIQEVSPVRESIEYRMNRNNREQNGSLRLVPEGVPVQDLNTVDQVEQRVEDNIDRASVSPAPPHRGGIFEKLKSGLGIGSRSRVDRVAVPQQQGPSNPGRRIFVAGTVAAAGLLATEAIRRSIAPGTSSGSRETSSTPVSTVENNGSSQTATPKAEDTATQSPSSTATQEVAKPETVSPEILGNGKYNSIEEIPNLTDLQKESARKFLEGSTLMIAGDGSVVALENTIMGPHQSENAYGELVEAPEFKKVYTNTEQYPDAVNRQDDLVNLLKYELFMQDNPSSPVTPEEYTKGSFNSKIWAYEDKPPEGWDGKDNAQTNILTDRNFDNNALVIAKFVESPKEAMVIGINNRGLSIIVRNNVILLEIFSPDPGAFDFNQTSRNESEFAKVLAWGVNTAVDKSTRNSGVSVFPYIHNVTTESSAEFSSRKKALEELVVPVKSAVNEGEDVSIYEVEGISARFGKPIKSSPVDFK